MSSRTKLYLSHHQKPLQNLPTFLLFLLISLSRTKSEINSQLMKFSMSLTISSYSFRLHEVSLCIQPSSIQDLERFPLSHNLIFQFTSTRKKLNTFTSACTINVLLSMNQKVFKTSNM